MEYVARMRKQAWL